LLEMLLLEAEVLEASTQDGDRAGPLEREEFVVSFLREYLEKACSQVCFAGVRNYGKVVQNLAEDRLCVIEILSDLDESDRLNLQLDDGVAALRLRCRQLIDAVIEEEAKRLQNSEIHPKLIWFLLDVQQRISEALSDNEALIGLEEQKRSIEYIHSQQLALALFKRLEKYFSGESRLELMDVGSKTGDMTSRLAHEFKAVGLDLKVEAYDLDSGFEPLAAKFAEHYAQPFPEPVEVRQGDLLELSESVEGARDVVLLSNVLHKIHPSNHDRALEEAKKCLKPGGLLIINTPYFSRRDASVLLHNFYRTCDTTSSSEALLAFEKWRSLALRNGFEIVGEEDIGFEGSLLDGFCHRALVLRNIS
ncbi:class I SAM-dependent methyltransferase, partial [Candidatus Peregrinibacteria bacterium]|nr:class I SAM-dependent methyltransferase [Candidatus Peregrinibacteria bacterium]